MLRQGLRSLAHLILVEVDKGRVTLLLHVQDEIHHDLFARDSRPQKPGQQSKERSRSSWRGRREGCGGVYPKGRPCVACPGLSAQQVIFSIECGLTATDLD